jgi:hypothetical protein
MIGSELSRQLADAGHTVVRLVRRQPQRDDEVNWAPAAGIIDFTVMERVDAVVNLSGASLSRLPWTTRYRKQILDSRVGSTRTLADAMRMVTRPPAVFVSGSAVGFYGDQPGHTLTEDSPKGQGFLSDVVGAWEATAHLAPEATRVVTARTGLVLGRGGAMKPLLPAAKVGLAGPIGTGGQYWPWIGLHDEAAAIVHLLTRSDLSGAVNLAGPQSATADALLRELASQLHRHYGLRVPERLIETTLGDAGHELLLSSQKVVPARLIADGFEFRDGTPAQAIAVLLRP